MKIPKLFFSGSSDRWTLDMISFYAIFFYIIFFQEEIPKEVMFKDSVVVAEEVVETQTEADKGDDQTHTDVYTHGITVERQEKPKDNLKVLVASCDFN